MKTSTTVIGIIAVIGLILGGTAVLRSGTIAPITEMPVIDTNVGAQSGPERNNPFECINGVCEFYNRVAYTTATTTVCAIKSPSATSTLIFGSANFTVSSSSASQVVIAKSATAFATTTLLGQASLGANARGTILATTTPLDALDEDRTFAPNTFFVVGMAGGIGTFSPAGACTAKFLVN